jgi:hypothetical protein
MNVPLDISDAIDAHFRRRRLVLEIWALSDKTTAFIALAAARYAWLRGGSVEGSLRGIKEALAAGLRP